MNKKVPFHLGIIMDGNRRWAKEKKLPVLEGHRRGAKRLEEIGGMTLKKGIKILTVYAFSTENWKRSKTETNYLMQLLKQFLNAKNVKELNQKGVKLNIIGEREKLSTKLQKRIEEVEKITSNNTQGVLNLAVSYGGRPEIIQAIKKIIRKKISPDKIDEDLINENLWTKGLPYPDLIIRTSGIKRLSNFLTWQTAYSELYFTKKYWPDFTEQELDKALANFSLRQRRFGK
ncbi:MAG: polyprenyl diphosphate synthase [Patescibacteria group bacterium]|nr:polyprenyl diphosphate synthase [Patescibacteria group bacterium]